jgi:hypothetical protein
MSSVTIDLSEQAALHRQRIRDHMRRLRDQRKLVAELENKGEGARPARQALRVMLLGLEAMLAEHQRLAKVAQKNDIAMPNVRVALPGDIE